MGSIRLGCLALGGALLASSAGTSSGALIGFLDQISPTPAVYISGVDFLPFAESVNAALGEVTASLVLVPDLGCDSSDYSSIDSTGAIALVMRGTCAFSTKVNLADADGALGILIHNNIAGAGPLTGALVDDTDIPGLILSNDLGVELVGLLENGRSVEMHMRIVQVPEPNIIALLFLPLVSIRWFLHAQRRNRHLCQ